MLCRNPFGFDHTLTTGAVSGLNRVISSQTGGVIAGGIQTDAAINPGNSGGPLLDSSGNVIGVNTAIFTNTGTSAGVGFAIPIDTVTAVVPQLIRNGKVRITSNLPCCCCSKCMCSAASHAAGRCSTCLCVAAPLMPHMLHIALG